MLRAVSDPRLVRYQIMEPLGHGSQGTTFRGIDRADQSEVAIKVLSLAGMANWKGFDLFERECRVLARLHHPNIPRFIDHYASEESGDYFLVMELVEGRTLSRIVEEDGPLPRERLTKVFEQALETLAYLERQSPPIVHRDIKPTNLLLDATDHLHLVDFGGVRDAMRQEGGSTIVGTYGYMAPEQLHGEATGATDLYALGATILALITGAEPQDMPRKGLSIDLDRLVPRHPWRSLLGQMLEPDPARRIDDAKRALALLREGPPVQPRPTTSAAAPPSSSPRVPARRTPPELPVPQEELRALARSDKRPLAVLIWLLTAFGSGALTLVEAVFLPLVYKFLTITGLTRKSAEALEEDRALARETLRDKRRTLSAIAEATHPFQDEDEGA
jgi:serine/threonine protein kinase